MDSLKKGETIFSLCQRFHVEESVFREVNSIPDTTVLKAGQIIKIPRAENKKLKEKKVDTLVLDKKAGGLSVDSVVALDSFLIKPRKSKQAVDVVLMMPLYLDQVDQISISKFDIDQRKRKNYKNFDFIQFYEGILLGLAKLEEKGFKVVLRVYDVGQNDSDKVKELFEKPEVQNTDFIIALLYQSAFQTAAAQAMKYNTFIINPLSERESLVENNPYVIKYVPSIEAYATTLCATLKKEYPSAKYLIIHSNKPEETHSLEAFKRALEEQKDSTYKLLNWDPKANFFQLLAQDKKNVIISLYNRDQPSNMIYVSQLLNKLSPFKKEAPILVGPSSWLEMQGVDLNYLDRFQFTFADNLSLRPSVDTHKEFIDSFISRFEIEASSQFASVGYDLILHFVSGVQERNEKFWEKPNVVNPSILLPANYKRAKKDWGFENQKVYLYKLVNFKPMPLF